MKIIFLFFVLVKLMFALPIELLDKHIFTDDLMVEYLVDEKDTLSIADVIQKRDKFVISKSKQIDVGGDDSVWFRFEFKNNDSNIGRWMLYHALVRVDKIEFYCIRSSGETQKFVAGDLISYNKKQVPSRYQTLFFELDSGESIEIYAKVRNKGRITGNFTIISGAAFIEKNSKENLVWGIYFGFFIAMFFYNFWLFLSLKDKLYGVYTANITAMFAMMLVAYGFIQPIIPEYLLPHIDVLPHFFGVFAMLMFALFISLFFDIKKRFKKIYILLLSAVVPLWILCFVFLADIFAGQIPKIHNYTLFVASLLYALLILFVSAFMLYKKEKWAGYIFTISVINAVWIVILFLAFMVIVDENGMVEKVGIVKNFLHVSILSIVLGLRFSWLKQEKEISQKLFTEQSKRSIAGDTVSNITHQWKQPIAELSAVLSAVKADIRLGRLEPEALQKDCDKAFFILQKMASSVDFFQDFFRLESKNEKLNPDKAIDMALDVYARSFEQLGVTVKLRCDGDSFVYADSNGLLQVFSVILQNSKEAFRYKNIDNPTVGISVSGQNNLVVIEFIDNGGGCDGAVLKNIFNPFFGTKKESTGSGLYLAKIIVEQKMGGSITAYNRDGGLCVTIKLPAYFGDNL